MTFDDDYCQFPSAAGPLRVSCRQLGFTWPPPEKIEVGGSGRPDLHYKRLRYSAITDEQRANMTRICRGAEYVLDQESTHGQRH